jgi:hypothetical protein
MAVQVSLNLLQTKDYFHQSDPNQNQFALLVNFSQPSSLVQKMNQFSMKAF